MLNFIRKLELVLFYLFIFSIPLEKRHVFETTISRIDGHFIEWNSAALYLSDILFGLVILFWFLRIVKEGIRFPIGNRIPNIFIIFSLFIIISLISAINSEFTKLSLYHIFKIIEYGLLFFYIIINVKTAKRIIYTLLTLIASGFLQAILGIAQYLKQSSFNLKILGEVDLSPAIQNISKIDVFGEKLIRAYGTFPHSNVLACFLFVAIIFTVCLMLIQATGNCSKTSFCHPERGETEPRDPLNNDKGISFGDTQDESRLRSAPLEMTILRRSAHVFKLPIFIFILYVLALGLLLTFSRSGWLASLVSIIFIILSILFLSPGFKKLLLNQFKKNFSKISLIIIFIVFVAVTVVIFWPQITSRGLDSNLQDSYSLSGRELYNHLASNIIKDNLLLGVGPGLFVNNLEQYLGEGFEWWQLQPVHNVYLLILAEGGLFGFIAFFTFIFYILSQIRNINFKQKKDDYVNQILIISLASIIFSFFIVMLFDHYLWTIQQGALCFFLVLGLFYVSIKLRNEET